MKHRPWQQSVFAVPSAGPTTEANKVGAPTVAALLLDNMSGMAAVNFVQKAINSGMLNQDEGNSVLAIVQLATPGEAEGGIGRSSTAS